MAIRFRCPQCNKAFSVKNEYAGKKAQCLCGAKIVVPAVISVSKPSSLGSLGPRVASEQKQEVSKQESRGSDGHSFALSSGPAAEVAHISSPAGGPPSDSPINRQPVMSVEAKCVGMRKREPWRLDIYDTYAVFTDPENATQFRFPNETKRCGFATALISGYNFVFVPYSRRRCFLLDKDAHSRIKALHSNWSHLQKKKRTEQAQSTIDSDARKRLVGHVRWWSGFQLVVGGIGLFGLLATSSKTDVPKPFLIVLILVVGVFAVNAWRLRRWAILGEAILFTISSIWNAVLLLTNLGHPSMGKIAFYLSGSVFIAIQFFRAFKAGVGSSDSESTNSEEN